MHLFQRKDAAANHSADHKHGDKHPQPAQSPSKQSPRPEILDIADRMIKKYRADLEYLKDR